MSLNLGSTVLKSRVILAPMSGVTDLPFRKVSKNLGAGLVVSEMIASQALIYANKTTLRRSQNSVDEYPMAIQLAGCDPKLMSEAAKIAVDRGAAILDINMGCPVKKVTKGQAGSALMKDLTLATALIESVVGSVQVPVTLKMRTGWDDSNRNAPQLAIIAEKSGIQMITVHGRTRCQFYNGKADWNFIRNVKNSVSIPVVGNGDVKSVDDANLLLKRSGADGIMIGRASFGRPWFINQVHEFIENGKRLKDPDLTTRFEIINNHYEGMLQFYGVQRGIRVARKHLGWYTKGFKGSAAFREAVNRSNDVRSVKKLISEFYSILLDGSMG